MKRQQLVLGLFVIGALLFLNACGPDTPSPAGTIYVRYEAAVTSLNPLLAGPTGYSRFASGQIFQTLATLDPEKLTLAPLLITEIPTAQKLEGGRVAYDFEIAPEANWDNGTPITANDVLFTIKLILDPALPTAVWREYFHNIEAVEVDAQNPRKFRVVFVKYYMLGLESLCQIPIYPAYHYDPGNALAKYSLADLQDTAKIETISKDPAQLAFAAEFQQAKYALDPEFVKGSSAYALEVLDGERGFTLVRKADWWGDKAVKKNPYLAAYPQKMVYRVVKPDDAVESMLRSGDLDVALNMNAEKFQELRKDTFLSNRFDFLTKPYTSWSRWLFNTRIPQLKDKKARQALAHLVDYDYCINTVSSGLAQRTVSPVPVNYPYYAKDVKPYPYSQEIARKLFTEAGWADSDGNGILDKQIDGEKVEMELDVLYVQSSKATSMIANSLVETMRQGGVKINLVPADLAKISKDTREGNFQSALLAAVIFPGPVELNQFYSSSALAPVGDNRSALTNPELDKIMDEIGNTEDLEKRKALYLKAQAIIYDETPEVFLYSAEQRYIVAKRFNYVLSSNRPGFYEQYFKLKE